MQPGKDHKVNCGPHFHALLTSSMSVSKLAQNDGAHCTCSPYASRRGPLGPLPNRGSVNLLTKCRTNAATILDSTSLCIYIYIYIYVWSRAPRPPHPPNGLGSRPAFCGVGCDGIVWESLPPFLLWCGVWWVGIPLPPSLPVVLVLWVGIPLSLLPPCGVESRGGNPPPSLLWCGVWWGQVCAGKSWWGRICGPSRVGSPGGRKASLVRQRPTIFSGRKFCSETLGCPFRCFGRPWRFLLGTIQYRAI